MAPPATDAPMATTPDLRDWLAPRPGRFDFALRQGLACALVTLVVLLLGTPEAAIAVYLVFFLNRSDRTRSIIVNIAIVVVISLVVGLLLVTAMLVLDDAMLRVLAMAAISVALLFLTAASKLRPVGATLAMVIGFGLDRLGGAPTGGLATRAILDSWQIVAVPAAVCVVVNLLLAPAPRRLLAAALAERLEQAAAVLRGEGPRAMVALRASIAEGPGELPAWLHAMRLERTSPAADAAALEQAMRSTTAIMLLADRAPAAEGAPLATTLDGMAAILRRGRYPIEIALAPATPDADVTTCALRRAIEGFAVPVPGPAEPPAPKGGFFLPDAFSNPDHVHFALKTTGAAMLCYLTYSVLDWPGIHTCFITCYVVALATAAEAIEKLALRILGCCLGAAAGVAAMLLVIPDLTSVGALMIVVFCGAFAGAWVAAGGERIAYAGFQLSFAFFLCVIQGASPGFDMVVARDRVVGILFGTLVAYVATTRIAPVSVARRIDPGIAALVARLAALLRGGAADPVLAQRSALARDIELLRYEPAGLRPDPAWLAPRQAIAARSLDAVAPLALLAMQDPEAAARRAEELLALEGPEALDAALATAAETRHG